MKNSLLNVIKKNTTQIRLLYFAFFILIAFMHIYMLDKVPRGINADEAGSAYDAFCLGKYGCDRWLKSWPVYFINYRDGQNALYTYLLVPFIKIFGLNVLGIRIEKFSPFAASVSASQSIISNSSRRSFVNDAALSDQLIIVPSIIALAMSGRFLILNSSCESRGRKFFSSSSSHVFKN